MNLSPVASEMFWGRGQLCHLNAVCPHLLLRLRPGLWPLALFEVGSRCGGLEAGASLRPLEGRFGGRARLSWLLPISEPEERLSTVPFQPLGGTGHVVGREVWKGL